VQRGTITRHRNNWILRFWEYQVKDAQRVRVRAYKNLAPIGPAYPTKKSVESLAWKQLEPINTKRLQPEGAMPIADFIENVYFPFVKEMLRPSTYKDYKRDIYERHDIKGRLAGLRLRDFRTVHGQKMVAAIAKDNPELGHKTLLRLKSFLSGVFRQARVEGFIDEQNPMRDVTLPQNVRRKKFIGGTYTIKEILRMMELVSSSRIAFTVIATAAFTGLRLAELRGIQWGDLEGGKLRVSRTVWRTKEGLPKTESSEGTVPVLPVLQMIMDNYRQYLEGLAEEGNLGKTLKPHYWMFAGEKRGTPLNLMNLVRRTVVPLLTRCVCGVPRHQHDKQDHAFELDKTTPRWLGWHAFRRSLATNLYALGVHPRFISSILRHSDISSTLKYYIETPESESREALTKLESLLHVS
jgi:integrase